MTKILILQLDNILMLNKEFTCYITHKECILIYVNIGASADVRANVNASVTASPNAYVPSMPLLGTGTERRDAMLQDAYQ